MSGFLPGLVMPLHNPKVQIVGFVDFAIRISGTEKDFGPIRRYTRFPEFVFFGIRDNLRGCPYVFMSHHDNDFIDSVFLPIEVKLIPMRVKSLEVDF